MSHLYLAVDRDGTEKASNSHMVRRKTIAKVWWGMIPVFYSKQNRHRWGDSFSTDELDAIPFMGTVLPKGSIEKLTGQKITWKDEQIEIPIDQ